jgi:hypothetical protein
MSFVERAAWMAAVFAVGACSTSPPASTSPASPAPPAPPSATAIAASAQPEAPAAPPYDLAADRERIRADAQRELGAGTQTQIAQGVFVLVAAPGWNQTALAASTDLTTRAIDAYFNGRFDKRPDRAIGVYLFANAATYQAYCKAHLGGECDSPFGMYHPDIKRIVMNAGPGLGTLTHELVHPIVESDFPSAPIWLNEGIASLFEAPVLPAKGEIHGIKNWRLPRLLQGMRTASEKGQSRLDVLFGMTEPTFRDADEKLHYATARYVCQWLDQKGWLWPFYRAYRDHVATDPSGEKAFAQATGMSPAQANAVWTSWVKAL